MENKSYSPSIFIRAKVQGTRDKERLCCWLRQRVHVLFLAHVTQRAGAQIHIAVGQRDQAQRPGPQSDQAVVFPQRTRLERMQPLVQ